MTNLILHQYELSPFSEKVRRILAFKQLAWSAVRAPAVMPKSDLVALTGGYRKIPVLQVGNHVYCDSARIAEYLEDQQPEPSLYGSPLAPILAEWADSLLFESTVPLVMRPTRLDALLRWLTPDEQQRMPDDRRAMRQDALRRPPSPKSTLAFFGAHLRKLEAALSRHEFLTGAQPCIADFSVYHCLWIVDHVAPERLAPFAALRAWISRVAAIPEPIVTPLSSQDALRIARTSDPTWTPNTPFEDPMGFQREQVVQVRASDYGREAVVGELVASNTRELVLRRTDDRAGCVYVHFPRLGYEVTPPTTASIK
jgi:glutathione S-transferase